jgi:hypothetical protein
VAAKVLAPSPMQLEREVRDAGIADGLAALVPQRTFGANTDDKDRIAVRTGIVLAYTILAGRSTPKAEFVAQLRTVREGMAALGTGAGLLDTMDRFVQNAENDAASREDFLTELDGVSGMMVPDEGWGRDDRTGPLLQAGAWLAGTNLVARAIVSSGKGDAAEKLLHRPEVANYFLGYLKDDGAAKAGSLAAPLGDTLRKLAEIGAKANLGVEDAKAVADSTEALFGYL